MKTDTHSTATSIDLAALQRYDHRGALMVPDSTGDYLLVPDVREALARRTTDKAPKPVEQDAGRVIDNNKLGILMAHYLKGTPIDGLLWRVDVTAEGLHRAAAVVQGAAAQQAGTGGADERALLVRHLRNMASGSTGASATLMRAAADAMSQRPKEGADNPEYLAARLGRVAKLAGVKMPDRMTDAQIAEVAPTILGEIARALEQQAAAAPDWISDVVRDVAELPDRDSPEGQPDMMLVTVNELHDIIARHAAPARADEAGDAKDVAPVIPSYDMEKVKALKFKFVDSMIHSGIQYRTCGAISAALNRIIDDSEAAIDRAAMAAPTEQTAKAPAAAVRAAERIDAMHKGVVGVFAAIKAEHDAAQVAAPDSPSTGANNG